MSGIAVVSGTDNRGLVYRMLDRLRHRGPDGNWVYTGRDVAAGCASLAAESRADRKRGCGGPGEVCLVADASIYNIEALRKTLPRRRFGAASDTDIILHLYGEHGPSCLGLIDGIFALAISDKGRLFVARDPLGIKPLYYSRKNGSWCFASELKALTGEFQGVAEFPPGHFYDSEQGFHQYFELEQPARICRRPEKLAEELKAILDAAVRKRLPPDGEVGVLLSGGLDSSTVGVLARRHTSNIHSFTAGTDDSEDLKHARSLAQKLGTHHHEYIYSLREMLEVLPRVVYHLESFDYLLVRSSIPNYIASRMASDYVKVVLCGEGSDELFAGYDHLKKQGSGAELNSMLAEMIFSCHNTGLQRVDRMNMANSVEGRMPYFDLDLLKFALAIPACYKIHPETRTEKWIVRKAFEDDLPDDIAWRRKEKFSVGAGSYELMAQIAENGITDTEFEAERQLSNGHVLRNKEELMYYRLFRDFFGDDPAVLNTVGITPIA
ncbi:MAG TPA: asparagine synthase-related protein [Armatimonadota bacterium]|nr:asparagine synthase-related protein [Armatimonadota bacterium]